MIEKSYGFNYCFDSDKCFTCGGKCCTGKSGYIWINEEEISILAAHLGICADELKSLYLEKFGIRYSIKEKNYDNAYACIFFDEVNKNCGIYEFRPKQCKTFPFWDYFKKHFDELEEECIGVKHF